MKLSTQFLFGAMAALIIAPAYAELPEVIPPPSTTAQVVPATVEAPVMIAPSIAAAEPVPPSTTTAGHPHHKKNGIRVSLNIEDDAGPALTFTQNKHHGKHGAPFWIGMRAGEPIPANAVIGGSENNPDAILFVCRAHYRGGVHPGKLVNGNCNIAWSNREVALQHYEVLVSSRPLTWVESSYGDVPRHALAAGSEHGRVLYACQAEYANGTHPGKVIGDNCQFGWGGRAMASPYYSVLKG